MSGQSDVVLSMDHVSKKFRRGEIYDSLRDLIPATVARLGKRQSGALRDREFWALDDISFEVCRGEAFGIIGSNGAGKSTILKLLSGIMKPTRGRLTVRGRLSALIEVGAGFHPDLTGRENIYLNGTILGMTKEEIRRKFDDIVDFGGLRDFIDTPVKRYSSGMYARLGFSVAAHVEPDLLIVDEVLSVGDYLFQQKCIDRMTSILKSGTTVLFVSHNLHAVSELCQRSMLLEKGKLLAQGPSNDVIRQYVGRAQNQSAGEGAAVVIQTVALRGAAGVSTKFDPTEKLYVDVKVAAQRKVSNLSVVIQIVDNNFYSVFDTCTARLNDGVTASLDAGEQLECSFELNVHLAAGTYHVNVYAHEYVVEWPFSTWRSAASFFVGETRFIKGAANLYPRLDRFQVINDQSRDAASDSQQYMRATALVAAAGR
ncbi:MAG TPA: ABC transporter ATP-binding protein [Gemmatimonadaceae bacterium]|nr:ABC transporter ATP-binding protein [Gemmatimonadaceae bacterium]